MAETIRSPVFVFLNSDGQRDFDHVAQKTMSHVLIISFVLLIQKPKFLARICNFGLISETYTILDIARNRMAVPNHIFPNQITPHFFHWSISLFFLSISSRENTIEFPIR